MTAERRRAPEIQPFDPIKRIFIANRGEIALRAAKTFDARGIKGVIPYSLTDPDTPITRFAEDRTHKGWALSALGGTSQNESYANPEKVLQEIKLHGCDAVFLGYGFLAEDHEFVASCEKAGVKVLAPPSDIMQAIGDKLKAREFAKKVKIGRLATTPVVEGTPLLSRFADVAKAANRIGYPVMIKDPNSGGGMGNVVARNREELERGFAQLRIGSTNEGVFLEHFIQRAVHVEVQIAADKHGNVLSLGTRDCTMQRRSQKVVEESPSPHVSDLMQSNMQKAAVNFAKAIGYNGVGTWEFIVDLDAKGRNNEPAWYFMEVNPRIQVEHPVTEQQITIVNPRTLEKEPLDIVGLMVDIAEGKKLPAQNQIQHSGHIMEARVYAENTDKNFQASSGRLEEFKYPIIDGIRIDIGYEEGDEVSPWFDPTLCKIIANGNTREEARHKLEEALSQMKIRGVSNNVGFLRELINTPEFRNATGTTRLIEEWWRLRQKDRIHSIAEFLNGGTFTPIEVPYSVDPTLLPQDIAVPSRRSDKLTLYSDVLQREQQKTKEVCAADIGIVERDGRRFVLYHLNPDFMGGTFGLSEIWAFYQAAKYAHENKLPLITVATTGGARQQENNIALEGMNATINFLNVFTDIPFHANIYTGGNYGGGPASFSGAGEIQITVDSEDSKTGFAGPYITALSLGKQPTSFRAKDAYAVLPEGTHTPIRHYEHRTVHVLVPSLRDASDKIVHLLYVLNIPSTITDPTVVFKPYENIGYHQASTEARRFDRPGRFAAWFGDTIGTIWHRGREKSGEVHFIPPYEKISDPVERMKIVMHPGRPTTADFLDTSSGIFEDVVLLSNPPLRMSGIEQYPPVIAAVARYKENPVAILGHQTQRVVDPETGRLQKMYDPQKPQDWEYTMQMINFFKKSKLPLILFGDTTGADCLPHSEDQNQSHKIARTLEALDQYPFPVLSINIGIKGSGGGATFIRIADAAADLENAMSFVSDPMVQYFILTGQWIDQNALIEKQRELESFTRQLKDATAEGRLALKQIDTILKEGRGGAHINPRIPSSQIGDWLDQQLEKLARYDPLTLLKRRHQRILESMLTSSRRNPTP